MTTGNDKGRNATALATGGLLALLIPALLLPAPAAADNPWKTSSAVWKGMDRCTLSARKQFPDYTAEANAKREAARQKCLRSGNLPGEVEPQQQPQQPASR
jgi:hypothetical protein